MKTRLYVIWDRVSEDAGPISGYKNDGVALREFQKYIEKLVEQGHNREDFDLMYVGTYDNEDPNILSGEVVIVEPRISMVDEIEEDEVL